MEVVVVNILTDSVLTESKTARDNQLAEIESEQATEILEPTFRRLNWISNIFYDTMGNQAIASSAIITQFSLSLTYDNYHFTGS